MVSESRSVGRCGDVKAILSNRSAYARRSLARWGVSKNTWVICQLVVLLSVFDGERYQVPRARGNVLVLVILAGDQQRQEFQVCQ